MPWRPLVPVQTAFHYQDPSERDALLDYIVTAIWNEAQPKVQDDGTTITYYDGYYVPGTWNTLRRSTISLGDWIWPNDYYPVSDATIQRAFCPPTPWPRPDATDTDATNEGTS